ncbi:MAG: pyruvate carboxylase subunit B [Clostridia bacterium]|nr:pyruvate carboxylase subunit B [Oscillospiraceae bacterium]MBQ3523087.1 pyruvate carboxylase subunit B [Clostridia bacterium]
MKVQFTETVLRDANQSLIATRMPFADFEPVLEKLNKAGYYSLECWGGATFDSCLRYLNEDPWERLRNIKAKCPDTKLQMLLRGQNLLGYKHYPDDVVRMFIKKSIENGIDVIRIFDALNDVRNIQVAVDETIKNGAIASGAISYTTSPVHTLENYVALCKEMKEMGCSTICIKDMAGVMTPVEAKDLVGAIKDAMPEMPVILHTHCTTGMAYMTILKAVEAGCDIIDTATSCFSGGTAQPATETLYDALTGLGYETGLDRDTLKAVNDHFKPLRDQYLASGLLKPKALVTDTDALTYKVPGGMLSNMMANLEDMNALDRMEEALLEIPQVRKDMGYPPLVTPLSQMVGNQAVTNVLVGERYKNISKEIKAYIKGEYGKAPGPIDADLQKKVLGDDAPITCRFADTLEPAFEQTKAELGDVAKCDEDVLSYIAFPQQAEKFFEARAEKEKNTFKYSIKRVD